MQYFIIFCPSSGAIPTTKLGGSPLNLQTHFFIINPSAGKGKGLSLIPEIQRAFAHNPGILRIAITKAPGDATSIAKEFSGHETGRIYSVGGDGTLNEVLNGMAGSKCSLGVIPCGSGNDFYRSLHPGPIPGNIIERTINGTERTIDIATINGRYFINIASTGFDADVVSTTIALKKHPLLNGSMAYILGILGTLINLKSRALEIDMDGQTIHVNTVLLAAANGEFYGGGMQPVPGAKLDDGFLDICIVRAVGRLKALALFPLYIKGRHGKLKEVSFHRCKRLLVRSSSELPINIDGEITKSREAAFELIPSGINVIIPE